jgi:exodeoxyribonuclease VIII
MRIDLEFVQNRPLSYSSIKEFAKSPRHYVHYVLAKREPSKAMDLGSLIHCLIMYPSKFNNQFIIAPNVDRRTKDGKATWEEFMLTSNGKTVITEDELAEATQITDNVMSNWKIKNTVTECTSFEQEFKHDILELPFRGFVDGIKEGEYILEIKTMTDASPSNVTREFYNRKYHIQAGLYNLVHKLPVKYLIVETKAPYNSMLVDVSDDYIIKGQQELMDLAEKFTICMDLDAFNAGYAFMESEEFVIGLPSWVK